MAKETSLRDMLKKLDGEYKGVDTITSTGGRLPDGRYQFRIGTTKAGIIVNQDRDGGVRARVVLEVVSAADNSLIGRKVTQSWNIMSPDGSINDIGVGVLKGDLAVMGQDAVTKASEVPEALEACIGCVVEADVSHKAKTDGSDDEWENIYFRQLAQAPAEASASGKKKAY